MKPYVICHMCTTIAGRILGGRWPPLPGGKNSSELFESTADSFGIGAWLASQRGQVKLTVTRIVVLAAENRWELRPGRARYQCQALCQRR